jgi:hypothetical protein
MSSTLFADTFAQDAIGSVPVGWSVFGPNAGWSVQLDGSNVYAHNGWSSSTSAGNRSWTDYTLSVDVKPSAWQSEVDGVDVRYLDSKDFYSLRFVGASSLVFGKQLDDGSYSGVWTQLASVPFAYNGASWYRVVITAVGASFTLSVNGQRLIAVSDSALTHGQIGLDAVAPVEYGNVIVASP